MNKRQLNRDLLLSGTYRQQIVKAKKGKGSYQRQEKHREGLHKKYRHSVENGGIFFVSFFKRYHHLSGEYRQL